MYNPHASIILRGICALTAALLCTVAANAQTDTTLTYQGKLDQAGTAVNQVCDFRFQLFDAVTGGIAVSSLITQTNVGVANGLFTVPLDFGANAFNNAGRWLQISVRCPAGSGTYTMLAPRQPVTRAPYSIQTRGIFVDQNQLVGIGTTAPTAQLYIDGTASTAAGLTIHRPASTTGSLIVGGPNGELGVSAFANNGHRRDIRFSNNGIDLLTNSTGSTPGPANGLTINELGYVGIGLQNAIVPLQVESSKDSTIYAANFQSTSQGPGRAVFGYSAQQTGVIGMSDGAAGTGVGVEGKALQNFAFDFYATGFGIDYGSSSSIRWKHNVEPIDHPLEKIAQLRGVYFNWNEDHGGKHDVGMIAEEVGAVLPEIVIYEPNGVDAIGMDYSKLTPLLVEAVNANRKETDAQVAQLQHENDALRARLEQLEQLVAELAAKEK